MKSLISVLFIAVVALAARRQYSYSMRYPGVVEYDYHSIGYHPYYSSTYERGEIRKKFQDMEYHYEDGSYEWVGADGVMYVVKYAGESNEDKPNDDQSDIGDAPGAVPPNIAATLLG